MMRPATSLPVARLLTVGRIFQSMPAATEIEGTKGETYALVANTPCVVQFWQTFRPPDPGCLPACLKYLQLGSSERRVGWAHHSARS